MTDPDVRPAVLVIVRDGTRVLLARHRYHETDLPVLIAGMIEQGETAEHAAAREVAEETGLAVSVDGILGTYVYHRDARHLLMIGCMATALTSEVTLDDELIDAGWYPIDELPAWPADLAAPRHVQRLPTPAHRPCSGWPPIAFATPGRRRHTAVLLGPATRA